MLIAAFQRGRDNALTRFGVKIARGAIGMPAGKPMHPAIAGLHADLHSIPKAPAAPAAPAAPQGASWADMHKGVAQQQAANINTQPVQLPPARAFEGHGSAAAGGGSGGMSGGGGSGGGGPGRFMRPVGKMLGKGLGYGALAAGGALAYGMHEQNKRDREGRDLVYAPTSGTF
jgi:hypothetical protein